VEAAADVLDDASKPVPLGLVLPARALGELVDELRLHRRKRELR
jgi:hypothetical protein